MSINCALNCLEAKTPLTGLVLLIGTSKYFDEDVVVVGFHDLKVYIPRSEMGIATINTSFIHWVGKELPYLITEVDPAKGYLIGSRKAYQMAKVDELAKKVEAGELQEFEAKIVKLTENGAYLEYDEVFMLLKNVDFAEDYTRVEDIYQVGDSLMVRVTKINNHRVNIEAVKKYKAHAYLPFAEFVPGDIVNGTVRTIQETRAYVNLIPSVDGMASIRDWLPIAIGDEVLFKVNQVREDGKIRGRILKNLTHPTENTTEPMVDSFNEEGTNE